MKLDEALEREAKVVAGQLRKAGIRIKIVRPHPKDLLWTVHLSHREVSTDHLEHVRAVFKNEFGRFYRHFIVTGRGLNRRKIPKARRKVVRKRKRS